MPTDTNPRANWTEEQFITACVDAKDELNSYKAQMIAEGKYAGPTTLGDTYSVWAGLVGNYEHYFPGHAPLPK